jgi:hypothetical protein
MYRYHMDLYAVSYGRSHIIYVRKESVENIFNWGGIKCDVHVSRSGIAAELSPLGCYAMSAGKELSVFRGVVTAFIFRMKQFQNSEVAVPFGAVLNCEVTPGVSTYTGTENRATTEPPRFAIRSTRLEKVIHGVLLSSRRPLLLFIG